MFSLFGRSQSSRGSSVQLSPDAFKAARTAESVVIDVRTEGEYGDAHLVGAEHVDVQASDFRERIDELDRNKIYYLYCQSGNRSETAT